MHTIHRDHLEALEQKLGTYESPEEGRYIARHSGEDYRERPSHGTILEVRQHMEDTGNGESGPCVRHWAEATILWPDDIRPWIEVILLPDEFVQLNEGEEPTKLVAGVARLVHEGTRPV
jgi:hypothetical protein